MCKRELVKEGKIATRRTLYKTLLLFIALKMNTKRQSGTLRFCLSLVFLSDPDAP